jgi:hypothetical protein
MYPDIFDIRREQHRITGELPPMGYLLPDVALAREFLYQAHHFCRNHGRHHWIQASELKREAEKFLGRRLSVQGFALALLFGFKINPSPYQLDPTRLDSVAVEFPPIGRFGECNKWTQLRQELENELGVK